MEDFRRFPVPRRVRGKRRFGNRSAPGCRRCGPQSHRHGATNRGAGGPRAATNLIPSSSWGRSAGSAPAGETSCWRARLQSTGISGWRSGYACRASSAPPTKPEDHPPLHALDPWSDLASKAAMAENYSSGTSARRMPCRLWPVALGANADAVRLTLELVCEPARSSSPRPHRRGRATLATAPFHAGLRGRLGFGSRHLPPYRQPLGQQGRLASWSRQMTPNPGCGVAKFTHVPGWRA